MGFIFLMGCTNNNRVNPVYVNADKELKVLVKLEQSMNQRLPKECGFGSLYYGNVEYHKGDKAYYLTVKDRVTGNSSEVFELDQFTSSEVTDKYIILYGNQLVGGYNKAISGKVLQVVYDNQIDFCKFKAWCAKQPISSSEPKGPSFKEFKYRGDAYGLQD